MLALCSLLLPVAASLLLASGPAAATGQQLLETAAMPAHLAHLAAVCEESRAELERVFEAEPRLARFRRATAGTFGSSDIATEELVELVRAQYPAPAGSNEDIDMAAYGADLGAACSAMAPLEAALRGRLQAAGAPQVRPVELGCRTPAIMAEFVAQCAGNGSL